MRLFLTTVKNGVFFRNQKSINTQLLAQENHQLKQQYNQLVQHTNQLHEEINKLKISELTE
jgi:cell division protein FtsB